MQLNDQNISSNMDMAGNKSKLLSLKRNQTSSIPVRQFKNPTWVHMHGQGNATWAQTKLGG